MDDSKSQAHQATTQPKAFNVDDLLALGMDEADLSEPLQRTKNGVKVKSVNKNIIGTKRNHYNAFTGGGELAFTVLARNPKKTLEQFGQAIFRSRMKTYIPREFDLPTYDKKEFFTQMEQEIMTIKLNPETY